MKQTLRLSEYRTMNASKQAENRARLVAAARDLPIDDLHELDGLIASVEEEHGMDSQSLREKLSSGEHTSFATPAARAPTAACPTGTRRMASMAWIGSPSRRASVQTLLLPCTVVVLASCSDHTENGRRGTPKTGWSSDDGPFVGSCPQEIEQVTSAPQRSAASAERKILGDVDYSTLGSRIVVADLLAGGASEVAFTALDTGDPHNTAYVGVLGDEAELLTHADPLWVDEKSWLGFGWHLGSHDIDGDGAFDLLISDRAGPDHGLGRINLLWGPLAPGSGGTLPASAQLVEDAGELGAFAFLGDWDDDGVLEIAVGAQHGVSPGMVQVFEVQRALPLDPDGAEMVLVGTHDPAGPFGWRLAAADLDGDGRRELLTGDYGAQLGAGEVRTFDPSEGVDVALDDARSVVVGPPDGKLGTSMRPLGDLNGDGTPDLGLLSSDPHVFPTDDWKPDGRAFILLGPAPEGTVYADTLPIQIEAEQPLDWMGTGMASADLDGDGWLDLLVGAPGHGYSDIGPGKVYVFRGPITEDIGPADAALVLVGECDVDKFGATIATGDVDGDAIPDVVVSATGNHELAENGGAIYIFSGAALTLE